MARGGIELRKVTRNRAWVEREYGHEKWPAMPDVLETRLAAGESNKARLLSALKDAEQSRPRLAPMTVSVTGRHYSLPASYA
jgi:hypothetical protein